MIKRLVNKQSSEKKHVIFISLIFFVFFSFSGYNSVVAWNNVNKIYEKVNFLPDVVYFDYDGTINDNDKYIKPALKYAIDTSLTKDQKRFYKHIKDDFDVFDFLYTFNLYDKAISKYDAFLLEKKFKPVKDVINFFDALKQKNVKMVVASAKYKKGLKTEIENRGISNYFVKLYGSNETRYYNKPSKEYTNKIEKELKLKSGYKCWNFGDTKTDVVMGRNFGCITFMIDTKDKKRILEAYKEEIDKTIFFVKYQDMIKLLEKIPNQSKKFA